MKTLIFVLLVILLDFLCGCSTITPSFEKIDTKLMAEARANSWAEQPIIDVLPEGGPKLALKKLNDSVEVELGAPPDPAKARDYGLSLLKGDAAAWIIANGETKSDSILATERDALKAQLTDLGKKYEVEHNKNIVTRIWEWAIGTIGLGGIIALCVLFPALLPILGLIAKYAINLVLSVITGIENWVVGEISSMAHKQPTTQTGVTK